MLEAAAHLGCWQRVVERTARQLLGWPRQVSMPAALPATAALLLQEMLVAGTPATVTPQDVSTCKKPFKGTMDVQVEVNWARFKGWQTMCDAEIAAQMGARGFLVETKRPSAPGSMVDYCSQG